jgi:uncharacterized protein involved in exopolysaccharide biosynthesis
VSSTPEDIKQPGPAGANDEISLLEILVALARHKRLVFVFPFACAVIAALISLALPDVYTGTAKILPPQQGGSSLAAALLGDVGGLSGGGGVGSALGLKNPSDLYVGMLRSRTIADAIIQRFELQKLYEQDSLVETRKMLATFSNITADPNGIISIEVDDEDPKRAAEVANTYVEELDQLTQKVAITSASRQRVFLEKQLRQAKDQLADAEVALRTTQQQTGLISLTEQGKAAIESVAYLQAQIQAKQVQLGAMRTGMTESNPDYVRTQKELAGLQVELRKLEKTNPADTSGVIPSAGTIPERGLEYVRKFRDVQYQQTLFDLIAKQYEIAKAQEAAEASIIQVLDRAVAPDRKSKPSRLIIVLVTGILTGMLGMVAALVLEARNRAKKDPVQSQLIEELAAHLPKWGSKRSG